MSEHVLPPPGEPPGRIPGKPPAPKVDTQYRWWSPLRYLVPTTLAGLMAWFHPDLSLAHYLTFAAATAMSLTLWLAVQRAFSYFRQDEQKWVKDMWKEIENDEWLASLHISWIITLGVSVLLSTQLSSIPTSLLALTFFASLYSMLEFGSYFTNQYYDYFNDNMPDDESD